MKILLLTLSFLCCSYVKIISQETTKEKSDYENGVYTVEQKESLENDSKLLEELSFKDAVKKFGAPYESEKTLLTDDVLERYFSKEKHDTYFHEKKYQKQYMLEATWKILSASWITIWDILDENNVWQPFDILIDV